MRIINGWIFLFFLVPFFPFISQAQDASASSPVKIQEAQDTKRSCRQFVQSFYDWYVKRPDWPRALKDRSSVFNPELFRRLKEDREVQAKSPGDIAGLDFDPFLYSQDPGDHYTVGLVKLKSTGTCWVEIFRGLPSEKSKDCDVGAELVKDTGQWQFINFYYPSENCNFSGSSSRGGLLAMLKNLQEAERKAAKLPPPPEPPKKMPPDRVPAPKHP